MRILMFTPTYYPRVGGAENLVHEIASRLVKKGHDVDLVVPHIGDSKEFEVKDGVNVYRVNKHFQPGLLRHLINQFYQYKKMKELSRRNRYDIIHAFYTFASGIAGYLIKKKLQIPYVMTLTGQDIYDPVSPIPKFMHEYLKWCMKFPDSINAISMDQRKYGAIISRREDIEIITPGVDVKRFNPNNMNKTIRQKYKIKGKMIFTVKRLYPRAGIEYLIDAAKMVVDKEPETKFIIAGKGPLKDELQSKIDKMGLSDNVTLAGFVSDEELPKYYATSDIFALSSLYEGFGIVFIEAMASGTPCVVFDAGACGEVVIDKKTGFVVPLKDTKAFGDAILKLVRDRELLKKYSLNSIKLVKDKYDWDKIIDAHVEVYNGKSKSF